MDTTVGLVILLWTLGLSVDTGWAESPPTSTTPKLPFHFIAACTTTTATNNKNSSTALLFYHPTLTPSPCQCLISSHAPFNVTRMWWKGNTSITTLNHHRRNPTEDDGDDDDGDDDDCEWEVDEMNGDECQRNGSHGLPLTLRLEGGSGGGGDAKKRGRMKKDGGGFVLLVVQATKDSVRINCTNTPTNHTGASGVSTETTVTQSNERLSNTSKSGLNTTGTSTTDTMTGGDNSNQIIPSTASATITTSIDKRATEGSLQETTQAGVSPPDTTANTSGHKADGAHHQDEPKDQMHFVILGVGVACIITAFIIVIVVIVKQRRRKKQVDVENTPPSPKQRKTTSTSTSNNNNDSKKKSKATNKASTTPKGSSRDSLINENHNYEEVSDDGLVGVGRAGEKERERKISHHTHPPETNYSHIKTKTIPTTTVTIDDDNDDYNRLDLGRASHSESAGKTLAPEKKFYVGDGDDDYMDVGDADGDNKEDDAHSDIYEAVDEERTPLCSRRAAGGRQEYMDCMSMEDGKISIAEGKVNFTCVTKVSKPADAASKTKVCRRPSLPLSPPPKANKGSMDNLVKGKFQGKGLNRNNSRSVDNLLRLKFQGQGHHRHSKSVDLNQSSLCRQRDLFLQNFRTQGDGAESSETKCQPADCRSSDVAGRDNPHSSNIHDKRPDIPKNPPPKGHPLTSPSSHTHNPPRSPSPNQPNGEAAPVMLRRKSRNSKKKGGEVEGQVSMVDYLKELNTGLLELETAVRHSMEIKDDELVMIDNVLYGTLPRNLSLPTTEL